MSLSDFTSALCATPAWPPQPTPQVRGRPAAPPPPPPLLHSASEARPWSSAAATSTQCGGGGGGALGGNLCWPGSPRSDGGWVARRTAGRWRRRTPSASVACVRPLGQAAVLLWARLPCLSLVSRRRPPELTPPGVRRCAFPGCCSARRTASAMDVDQAGADAEARRHQLLYICGGARPAPAVRHRARGTALTRAPLLCVAVVYLQAAGWRTRSSPRSPSGATTAGTASCTRSAPVAVRRRLGAAALPARRAQPPGADALTRARAVSLSSPVVQVEAR